MYLFSMYYPNWTDKQYLVAFIVIILLLIGVRMAYNIINFFTFGMLKRIIGLIVIIVLLCIFIL